MKAYRKNPKGTQSKIHVGCQPKHMIRDNATNQVAGTKVLSQHRSPIPKKYQEVRVALAKAIDGLKISHRAQTALKQQAAIEYIESGINKSVLVSDVRLVRSEDKSSCFFFIFLKVGPRIFFLASS